MSKNDESTACLPRGVSLRPASLVFSLLLFAVVGPVRLATDPVQQPFLTTDGTIALPHKSSTIPYFVTWLVLIPASAVFAVVELLVRRKPRPAFLNAWLNYSLDAIASCFITFALTESCKLGFGSLRPDFLDRCQPHATTGACTNTDTTFVNEGRVSFPSGHTSQSFAVGVYMTLYAFMVLWMSRPSARADARNGLKREAIELLSIVCCLLPMVWAIGVAASRIVDNRHRPVDVVGGAALGSVVSFFCFTRMTLLLGSGSKDSDGGGVSVLPVNREDSELH